MKQENPKNSRKKVWLIVAIIALLAAIGVALALILPGLLQPQEGIEPLENPQVYFNLDRNQMLDPETTLSTRTPGEDGLYHIRFSIYGEVKEVSVINDKRLVNYIDTLDVLCPVLDENGVITDVQTADQHFLVTNNLFVKRMLNGNLEANSSTAMNGMDAKFPINEASGIYDCQPTAANPGTPSEAEWLDKIIAVTDKEKTYAHIYIVDNEAFEGEVAWRAAKNMYANNSTTRVPDENGVYTMEFFIDGKLVERKCKDKDKVSQIDKIEQFSCVVALEYDEEGYIIDWFSPSFVLRGFELCKSYTVTAVENGTFSATYLMAGSKQGDTVEATYDDTCKIWDCCRGCKMDQPTCEKTTELKVGDIVSVYTDLDGKLIEIYVGLRQPDSPMYFNVTRMWSTANQASTRVPDAEGYYHIDLAVNGKVKEFKTKNVEHVNYIDSLYYFTVGLKTSGNIIKEVYAGNCVCGYTGAFVNRYVTNTVGTVVSVVLPPDLENGKNWLTSGKCEIYDVSGDYGTTMGQKTSLKVGDRVIGFINTESKLTHVYVTQHYNEGMTTAYNMNRQYSSATKGTARTLDANGYYVFDLAINGAVKQYKTKSKAMADFIDQQSPYVVGVKVSGDIIKDVCFARSTALYGTYAYTSMYVDNTRGNILSVYSLNRATRTDNATQYKITSKTKIYNVSGIYDKQPGEKTKLQANDRVCAIVNSGTGELAAIYVLSRTANTKDIYWQAARVTGTHLDENGVKVTNRTPNSEGYYVFDLLYNGERINVKTKDLAMATQIDSYTQGFGLILDGDIVKQVLSFQNTANFNTTLGNYDITKVTKDTIYATRMRAAASDFGAEVAAKYNKNTKFINVISSSPDFGKIVTPKVGDRVVGYGGSDGGTNYVFITQESSHKKGAFSYCPHCDKTVFWDQWSITNIADGMHCYLPMDHAGAYTFGVSTDELNCDMVLDLNGCTLTGSGLLVDVYDKLTIVDTVGGGKINGGGGGNIRVNEGATLTVLGGTITGGNTTLTGVGGNIYVNNGTVNVKGGTISNGVSYLGSNIYHTGSKGSVNITGGKVIGGSVYAENSKIINVSGNVEINNLIVKPGNIINVGKLASGASVTVKADGVFTNNGAASYIKNFKVTDAADAIAASGTALKYTNNSGAVVPSKPSVNDPLVLDADGMGMCMVCGEKVKWIPIHDGETIGVMRPDWNGYNAERFPDVDGAKYHFYIADDNMVSDNADFLYTWNLSTVCLHLNGKTANIKGGIYGGNDSSVNIMGEGTLNHLGTATVGTTKKVMFLYYTGSLNLYGGIFESNETILNFGNNNSKVKIATDAVVNETINLNQGKLTIDGGAQIQKIDVSGNGKVTINKDFTGSAVIDFAADKVTSGLVSASNGAATGDFAGQVITSEGNVIKNSDGRLAITATKVTPPAFTDEDITVVTPDVFDPANNDGKAFCEACQAIVVWTPFKTALGNTAANGHYYLEDSFTHNDSYVLQTSATGNNFCINLNGKTLTTNKGFYLGNNSAVNFMGDGEVVYTGTGCLFDTYSCTLKFYGGIYTANEENAKIQVGGSTYHTWLYNTPEFNGLMQYTKGSLHLVGSPKIKAVQFGNNAYTKLYVEGTFGGKIDSITFDVGLTDNKVPAAFASATAEFTGSITLADGRGLVKDTASTQLIATERQPVEGVFEPWEYNGNAYCPVCKSIQTWTGITAAPGALTAATNHIYLADNITYTTSEQFFMTVSGGKTCHFNMNGKNITSDVANVPKAYGPNVGGTMALFNTSDTESTWTAGCAAYGEFFLNSASGGLTLYDGVTLKASCTNSGQPIVGIMSGTFTMEGGTVDASGKDNVAAIQVRNTTSTAAFVMNGGEIISGTTGLAVRVGQSVAAGQANYAALNGGKISGNILARAGSVVLDKAGSPEAVSILEDAKLVVKETWTGNAVVGFTPAPVNGVVAAANGEATGAFTGGLFLADGNKLVKSANSNQLVVNEVIAAAAAMTFPTDGSSKVMDCPACGAKNATWTAYTGTAPTTASHLYVPANVEYSGNYMVVESGAAVICLHLNGKNITAKADGAYTFYVNKLNIMGNGVVTGNGTAASNAVGTAGAVFHTNFGKGAGLINIYGGTYKKLSTNTTNPILTIGQNGGTVNMYGGIIDASGTTITGMPTAVALQGSATGATTVSAPAYFNMYGGEIKGGTTDSFGGAIRVGGISLNGKYADSAHFVMHGGKITGGIANDGGSIYADANCGTLTINGGIITGGKAKFSGGNIYVTKGDLTIGAGAIIQNGVAGDPTDSTTSIGGGNIWFGTGTMTTAGKILNGECISVKGAGGNIFLFGSGVVTNFYMTDGEVKGGKLPTGDNQNYGCNICAYRVKLLSVTGGEISGGIGGYAGADNRRDRGRNLYAGYTTGEATEIILSNCNIDGEVFVNGGTLTLSGDLVIGGTERGLDLDNNITANVTGLTSGASIKLSGLDANTVFSGNCGTDAATLAKRFVMIDNNLTVDVDASNCLYVKTK